MNHIPYIRTFARLFRSPTDMKIVSAINAANVRNMRRFSLIVILLETVSLISYMAVNLSSPAFFRTVCNVSFCIIACVIVEIISRRMIVKYDRIGSISEAATIILVAAFYILLSIWGIAVDFIHYNAGEQMMTFYIVQFCFVCFVAVRPKIGSALIAAAFALFYAALFFADGAAQIQVQNFAVFMIIAIFGNAIKYSTLQETEQSNARIRELNQYLQQEAIIDDLTKIKNRKALRRDVEHFLGKRICVIIADVDHFKRYNDTYGHLVGDKVLSETAAVSADIFKEGEVYRYGGDEFLFMLHDCTEEECSQQIQAWHLAIMHIRIEEIGEPISCSSGISSGVINGYEDFRSLLKTADDRLYLTKKNLA